MSRYAVGRDGQIFCTDFLVFIYLDSVTPGEGGLCLVHGSHKARLERPPESFGTFGTANFTLAGTGVQPEGFVSQPHPVDGPNRGPAHTSNPCVRAGDIIVMSESTSHATLPWLGQGPRRALGLRFKPQHVAHPEDGLTEDEILRLPPEIRELRRYAPPTFVKAIASASGPPTALSPPTPDVAVTTDELTPNLGRPSQQGFHEEDMRQMYDMRAAPKALLPEVAGGLTPEQRYLFDIHGWTKLEAVVSSDELAACRAAADDYANAKPEEMPEGFGCSEDGGAWWHAHAWAPCLEDLVHHRKLWPAIMELTDGKPKLIDAELISHEARPQPGGPGFDGVRLHSQREELGWETTAAQFEEHHGRIHCGQCTALVHLQDADESDGPLLVVDGSHRSEFDRTDELFGPFGGRREVLGAAVPRAEAVTVPEGCVAVPAKAGDVVLLAGGLTRGAMPWAGAGKRQLLVLRYELQFSGVAPDVPPPVWARLSEETRSLMEYAHVLHTKPLAAGWVDSFYSARL